MNVDNLAWGAGLFEGEGTITGRRDKHRKFLTFRPHLALVMNDEDIVRRFHTLVNLGNVGKQGKMFRWQTNKFEYVQAVIAMLWPWLGERRKARAIEILIFIKRDHTIKQQVQDLDIWVSKYL